MPVFLNLCLDRFWSPRGGEELCLLETVSASLRESRVGDGSAVWGGSTRKTMHTKIGYTWQITALALLAALLCLVACKQNVSAPEADKAAPQQTPILPTSLGPATPAPP